MRYDYTKHYSGESRAERNRVWLNNSLFRFLEEDPAPFIATFENDNDLYFKYLSRVFGGNVATLITVCDSDAHDRTGYDIVQGIRFPHDAGLDPADPETAAWARFAIDRDIEFHPDAYMKMGRFTDPGAQVRQLLDAGVTRPYAEALDMATWSQKYDVDYAIKLAATGLPLDYAEALSPC